LTHDVFVEYEVCTRKIYGLKRLSKENYDILLKDLSQVFERVSKMLGVRKKDPDRTMLRDIRNAIQIVARIIEKAPGALTQKDCARIFEEFASSMT